MKTIVTCLVALVLAVPASAAEKDERANKPAPGVARQRRQLLDKLEREVFRKPLLARQDIRTAGPADKAGRMTELADGSYYQHADSSIAFEELGPVMVVRTALRDGGRTLLVSLEPPSRILSPALGSSVERIGVAVLADVDVEAAGGVREALATLVYMPGETPDAEAVARCMARYPDHGEQRSRLRCGGSAQSEGSSKAR